MLNPELEHRSTSSYWSRAIRRVWASTTVAVLACGVASMSLSAALAHVQTSSVAIVDQPAYDFGNVYEGEHVSHTFQVRNAGSAPLEIREADARAANSASEDYDFRPATLDAQPGPADSRFPAVAALMRPVGRERVMLTATPAGRAGPPAAPS